MTVHNQFSLFFLMNIVFLITNTSSAYPILGMLAHYLSGPMPGSRILQLHLRQDDPGNHPIVNRKNSTLYFFFTLIRFSVPHHFKSLRIAMKPGLLPMLLLFGIIFACPAHAQPQRTWTLWEHGTLISPEDPTLIAKASMSAGTRTYQGYENTTVIFYAPLSNPSMMASQSSWLRQLRFLFKTVGNAQITDLDIYSGRQLLRKLSGLQLAGDFSLPALQQLVVIDPVLAVKTSLNIAITVQFGSKIGTLLPAVNFVSIGGDFQRIALGEIHVYDSENHYIGIVIGHEDTDIRGIHIFIPRIGQTILLDKETGDIGHCPLLYYSSFDCSGTAYSDGPRDIIFKVPGVKAYRIVESGRPTETYVGSFNYYGYCYSTGEIYPLSESKEVLKSHIPFTLPVTLPLQYKYQ